MIIALTQKARLAMKYAVNWKTNEIAGFGKTRVENGIVIVEDVIIPKQYVGGAHAEMEIAELNEVVMMLAERGESLADYRFWWHSHPGSSTSPSGTDTNTMRMLAEQNGEWFTGLVTNQKGDYTGYAHICAPFNLAVSNISVVTAEELDSDLKREIEALCEANVQQGKPPKPEELHPQPQFPMGGGGSPSAGTNRSLQSLPPAWGGTLDVSEWVPPVTAMTDAQLVDSVATWLAAGMFASIEQIPLVPAT